MHPLIQDIFSQIIDSSPSFPKRFCDFSCMRLPFKSKMLSYVYSFGSENRVARESVQSSSQSITPSNNHGSANKAPASKSYNSPFKPSPLISISYDASSAAFSSKKINTRFTKSCGDTERSLATLGVVFPPHGGQLEGRLIAKVSHIHSSCDVVIAPGQNKIYFWLKIFSNLACMAAKR